MCTVTWLREPSGYELFFTRDEKITRKMAEPPQTRQRQAVRYVAPVDGEAGGTWIGANEFGVCVCLLNAYDSPADQAGMPGRSRGALVADLLDSPSCEEVRSRVEAANLAPYLPFTLIALEVNRPALVVRWNGLSGLEIREEEPELPLTSSSVDTAAVVRDRKRAFQNTLKDGAPLTAESLRQFHTSHHAGNRAFSICLHRGDAKTVSLTRVRVTGAEVRFDYYPDAPCEARPAIVQVLSRR